jgi:hypothetical protein
MKLPIALETAAAATCNLHWEREKKYESEVKHQDIRNNGVWLFLHLQI